MTNRDDASRRQPGRASPEPNYDPAPRHALDRPAPPEPGPRASPPPDGGSRSPYPDQLPVQGTQFPGEPTAYVPRPSGISPRDRWSPSESTPYSERIRVTDLVPQRTVVPARGWRRIVYQATFGWINPGHSPDERYEAELEAEVRAELRGHFKIGVLGKGGVGKTTVAACVGSVFAELRQEDRVVAIDADTAFGKLGSRIDPRVVDSYWELAGANLETFADARDHMGTNAAGLFVLAGESTAARRRVLDAAIYRESSTRLDRYFSIFVVDCSSTMDSPVTQEVLRDLDALVIVSSPWVDGAAAAGQILDWLANRGHANLLRHTIIVLNDSDGHADKRTRSILAQQFAGGGHTVVEMPFDGDLRLGGVINRTLEMPAATRRSLLEIAASLAQYFPSDRPGARPAPKHRQRQSS